MGNDSHEQHDPRPDIAKDEKRKPREKAKESWHNAEETMSEGPAGAPKAEKQSRTD